MESDDPGEFACHEETSLLNILSVARNLEKQNGKITVDKLIQLIFNLSITVNVRRVVDLKRQVITSLRKQFDQCTCNCIGPMSRQIVSSPVNNAPTSQIGKP